MRRPVAFALAFGTPAIFASGGCSLITGIDSVVTVDDASVLPEGDSPDGGRTPATLRDSGGALVDASSEAGSCQRSTGRVGPTSVAVEGSGNRWLSAVNVLVEDSVTAYSEASCCFADSETLLVRGFNFNIPSASRVLGVKVSVRAKGEYASDLSLRLAPGGTSAGANLKRDHFTAALETRDYGGPNVLWDIPLKPAMINSATFAIAFRSTTGAFTSADVDAIWAEVFYCAE